MTTHRRSRPPRGQRPTTRALRTAGPVRWLLALLIATVALAGPAAAHGGGDPAVGVVIDPLPAELEGMTVQAVDRLAFQLVVANPTDRTLEVEGLNGRVFLRIGPDGVEANLAATDWYTTNDPFGGTAVPDGLGGADRFGRVAVDPAWGWYDHRLHPGPIAAPDHVVAAGLPATFGEWTVPVRVDGVATAITGRYEYQPVRGSYEPRILGGPPADGPAVVLLPGPVAGLFMDATGSGRVLVRGVDGEPFLLFDPDFGVRANRHSRSWVASARASDGSAPDAVVDADAAPSWVTVADVPRFGWIEPRTSPVVARAEGDANGPRGGPHQWTVPLEVEGVPVLLEGDTVWRPLGAAEPSDAEPLLALGALAAIVAVGLVVTVRQRARRSRRAGAQART